MSDTVPSPLFSVDLTRQWGTITTFGVIDVVAGIVALIWPQATVVVLAIILGIALLMVGFGALVIGIRVRNGWIIALGAIALVCAIICIVHPGAGVWAIIIGTSFYFLLSGMGDLAMAMVGAAGRWLWAIIGVLSIAAGIVLLFNPHLAVVTVAVLIGIFFIIHGAGQIAAGLWLRSHRPVTARS